MKGKLTLIGLHPNDTKVLINDQPFPLPVVRVQLDYNAKVPVTNRVLIECYADVVEIEGAEIEQKEVKANAVVGMA